MQDRRNGAAAKRFFKHLLHGMQYTGRAGTRTTGLRTRTAPRGDESDRCRGSSLPGRHSASDQVARLEELAVIVSADLAIGLHGGQKMIGTDQIMRLTAGQEDADRIAKGVDQGMLGWTAPDGIDVPE